MQPFLIDLDDVTYTPDGVNVLCDVTLRASERRIGIVGRNGSGKTSLARVLAGLVAPSSGKLRINGVDVVKDRKAALRQVGILFQNPDHQIIFSHSRGRDQLWSDPAKAIPERGGAENGRYPRPL